MKDIQYEEILKSIGDWIWAVNAEGVYTYCSDNVYDFLGFYAEEVIGKTPFDFMSEKEGLRVGEIFGSHVAKKEQIRQLQNVHVHKNGSDVIVETTGIPIIDESGAFMGYQGFDRDITEKVEITKQIKEEIQKNYIQQQQLFQQSRLAQMGEMISMIAHQWRQPLAAISSLSIDMEMQSALENYDLKQEKEAQKYESYINNGLVDINVIVQNLTTTIEDFRNFHKISKEVVNIEISEVVSKVLNIIKSSIIHQNINIIEEYSCSCKVTMFDNEMMQVILNILKNAQDNFKEKSIEKPYIKIKTYEKENNHILEISDNGGGIPEDIIDNIFDPYFSTKDEKNGTGLGLYMSKIIIEEHHNGKLTVKNIYDGVHFIIELGTIE